MSLSRKNTRSLEQIIANCYLIPRTDTRRYTYLTEQLAQLKTQVDSNTFVRLLNTPLIMGSMAMPVLVFFALQKDTRAMVILLRLGADPDVKATMPPGSALTYSIMQNNPFAVATLLHANAKISDDEIFYLLMNLSPGTSDEAISTLFDQLVKKNSEFLFTPLLLPFIITKKFQEPAVIVTRHVMKNPKVDFLSLLMLGMINQRNDLIEIILGGSPDLSEPIPSAFDPLILARLYLDKTWRETWRKESGEGGLVTLLHYTWTNNNYLYSDLLLDHGFNPNLGLLDKKLTARMQMRDGEKSFYSLRGTLRMLHAACLHRTPTGLRQLLAHNAITSFTAGDICSFIYGAIAFSNNHNDRLENVRRLLEHDANPNGEPGVDPMPPISLVLSHGKIRQVKLIKAIIGSNKFDFSPFLIKEDHSTLLPLAINWHKLLYIPGMLKWLLSIPHLKDPVRIEVLASAISLILFSEDLDGLLQWAFDFSKQQYGLQFTLDIMSLLDKESLDPELKENLATKLDRIKSYLLETPPTDREPANASIEADGSSSKGLSARAYFSQKGLLSLYGIYKDSAQAAAKETAALAAESKKYYSWFNGALNSDGLADVEGLNYRKISTCFILIPEHVKNEQNDVSGSINACKLAARYSDKNVKRIKTDFVATINVGGQEMPATISGEVTLGSSSTDRLLLVEIPSDDNEATLFLAVMFAPGGLHNQGQNKRVEDALKQAISIELPARETKLDGGKF